MAPRPVLLQTGNTDYWSDPKGEFLSAIAARPVFALFGKKGPATDDFPLAGQLVGDTLGYYMHAGGDGTVPSDWDVYLKFMTATSNLERDRPRSRRRLPASTAGSLSPRVNTNSVHSLGSHLGDRFTGEEGPGVS